MACEVRPIGQGRYSVDWPGRGPFLTLTLAHLNELLVALQDEGMVERNGERITRPAR
jgi:hypothetical protein